MKSSIVPEAFAISGNVRIGYDEVELGDCPLISIIDTETTDKEGDYRSVEIAIGRVPFDSVTEGMFVARRNPGVSILPEAAATHHISTG